MRASYMSKSLQAYSFATLSEHVPVRHIHDHGVFQVTLLNGMGCGDHRLYRCAEGRSLMSPHGMAVSNTKYLSSSETRVNAGIKGWKGHLSEEILDARNLLVVFVSQMSEAQLLYSP